MWLNVTLNGKDITDIVLAVIIGVIAWLLVRIVTKGE